MSLADDAQSGTPHRITDDFIQLVGLVTQDRQVTVKAVATEVGSVHTIMTEKLNWHKVCPTTTGSMSNGPLY